jgi:hypothetical protein
VAAGLFFPRGHSGAAFAGGMAGGELGGMLGRVGEDVGMAAGVIGGQRAYDAASGLPERMLVAVSATNVYGFDTHREREREPTDLEASGSRVELEGQRIPLFHVSDVIDALRA